MPLGKPAGTTSYAPDGIVGHGRAAWPCIGAYIRADACSRGGRHRCRRSSQSARLPPTTRVEPACGMRTCLPAACTHDPAAGSSQRHWPALQTCSGPYDGTHGPTSAPGQRPQTRCSDSVPSDGEEPPAGGEPQGQSRSRAVEDRSRDHGASHVEPGELEASIGQSPTVAHPGSLPVSPVKRRALESRGSSHPPGKASGISS